MKRRRKSKKKSELDKLREKLVSVNLEDKKTATRKVLILLFREFIIQDPWSNDCRKRCLNVVSRYN